MNVIDKNEFLQSALDDLQSKGLKRSLRCVEGSQGREVIVDGSRLLNFCSNNYLGLADDKRLCDAAINAIGKDGFGSGASRLVCGNLSAHCRLEEKIAQFKGTEKGIVFSSGYMANVGIISALFGRDDIIFSDRLNHASIIDGILLSGAKFKRYPHCDMTALEAMLEQVDDSKRKVIITDSVFSMDGDIAPLDKIASLSKKYNCMTMVDEAHALGVLGKNGKGAVEYFGLEREVDIQMGTFSKAVGSFGAYCCGSRELVDYLINTARSFIYTTGMPPSVAAASLKGIEIIEQEPELRSTLWKNTAYMLDGLQSAGFDTLKSKTPIIPILVKDARSASEFSLKLFESGLFISGIRPPTVPQNEARLRVAVMASHKKEDLDHCLEKLKRIGKQLCII